MFVDATYFKVSILADQDTCMETDVLVKSTRLADDFTRL